MGRSTREDLVATMESIPTLESLLQTPHPPSPWRLRATMALSLFAIPRDRLAPFLPEGVRLPIFEFLGRCLIGAAWVDYGPKSTDCVLAYRELLVAVLARKGILPRVHIIRIWVDSPASLAGGRNLWAIPKDLAQFTSTSQSWHASGRQGNLAETADIKTSGPSLKMPFYFPMTLIQWAAPGNWLETPSKIKGAIQLGQDWQWRFPPESDLAALFENKSRPLKPWLNLLLRNVQIHFGRS